MSYLYRNYGRRILNTSRMFDAIWNRMEAEEEQQQQYDTTESHTTEAYTKQTQVQLAPITAPMTAAALDDPSSPSPFQVDVDDDFPSIELGAAAPASRQVSVSVSVNSSGVREGLFEFEEMSESEVCSSHNNNNSHSHSSNEIDMDSDSTGEDDSSVPSTLPPTIRSPSLLVLLRSTPTSRLIFSDQYFKFTLHTQSQAQAPSPSPSLSQPEQPNEAQLEPPAQLQLPSTIGVLQDSVRAAPVSDPVPVSVASNPGHFQVRLKLNLYQLVQHLLLLTSNQQQHQATVDTSPALPPITISVSPHVDVSGASHSASMASNSDAASTFVLTSTGSFSTAASSASSSSSFVVSVSPSHASSSMLLASGGWNLFASLSTS